MGAAAIRHPRRHRQVGGTTTRIATAAVGAITLTTTATSGTQGASTAAASTATQHGTASALRSNPAQEGVGGCVGATSVSASTRTSSKFTFAEYGRIEPRCQTRIELKAVQ